MRKPRLLTPGPTPVPEAVMLQMAQPIIHHRHAEFINLVERVNANLQTLFCTAQPVLTLTSSGTGAAEAAITSLFSVGEKGINVNNGKFAERWGKMMKAYSMNVVELPVEWGLAVSEEQLATALKQHPDAQCVWLVHSETSTGTYTDIKRMAEVIRANSNALVCIDGITSVGAHECRMDEWGLDVVITGSQKGLMIPPGLAFVALSERAWNKAATATLPKFYFDLNKARTAWEEHSTPWTPAVTLFIGLDPALQMIVSEGVENVWKRHERLSAGMRAGMKALNLRLFSQSPSHAVTTVYLPSGGKNFVNILKKDFGVTVIGGQDQLKDVVFRISHLGYYDEGDMLAAAGAIEQTLKRVGHEFEPGSGVAAMQRVFLA
jgi:aspartate aminotransferase-like enzyme